MSSQGRSTPVGLSHDGPATTFRDEAAAISRAIKHAQDRLITACEAISMIGALALDWKPTWSPHLSITRAIVQDASARAGEQAAHILPGQILIDGKPPWSVARGDRAIAAFIARFEVTASLPAAFNLADSQAEKAGLKAAFLDACERAWVRAAAGERDLAPVFTRFLEDATRAFEKAELSKEQTSRKELKRRDATKSDFRLSESLILRAYKFHGIAPSDMSRRFRLPS